jgi:hypothetical protein
LDDFLLIVLWAFTHDILAYLLSPSLTLLASPSTSLASESRYFCDCRSFF